MSQRSNILLTLVLSAVLLFGFGFVYMDDHSWGAWGDDSAGYIFLAGLMYNNHPLVYTDELAASGQAFFGDEKLARWLTPTHHQFLNTHGVIGSKYPLGMPLVLLVGALLYGSLEGMYLVVPLLAAVNLVLLFIFSIQLFSEYRYRHWVGFMASIALGVADLYYDHAISQPMREIPSMTFLLLSAITLVSAVRLLRGRATSAVQKSTWLLALSGLFFAIGFDIRETSAIVLPFFFLYALRSLWEKGDSIRVQLRRLAWPLIGFVVALLIGLAPTFYNSYILSKDKEVFKARDTSQVVLLSNIGHIETLSPKNIFDNEGKFRPGKGALPHYWEIMQQATPLPYFLVLVALGLWYCGRTSRERAWLLAGWSVSVLVLFSLWINPYSRYILPLFPPLLLLGVYGGARLFDTLIPTIFQWRWLRYAMIGVVIVSVGVGYRPTGEALAENLRTDIHRFKAISYEDLQTLKTVSARASENVDKPVLMFSGDWQYGTSETMQAHTGIKTIRFPLDQRFTFNEQEVNTFFEQMGAQGYDLTVWLDTTSSPAFLRWFEQQRTTLLDTYTFTFEPDARLYRVELPVTNQ